MIVAEYGVAGWLHARPSSPLLEGPCQGGVELLRKAKLEVALLREAWQLSRLTHLVVG